MKIINLETENETIKCPKCFLTNIDENGIKDICDHLVFVGTSHTDEPEFDKEKLSDELLKNLIVRTKSISIMDEQMIEILIIINIFKIC